jgi:hypothetical protein
MNRVVVALAVLALLGAAVAGGVLLLRDDGGGGGGAIERSELSGIAPREFADWRVVKRDTGFRGLEASWPGDLFAPERQQLIANGYVTDYLVRFRAPNRRGELFANLSLFRDEEGARLSEPIGVENVTEQLGRPAVEEPALGETGRRISATNQEARLYGYFWRVGNVVISVTAIGRNLGQGAVFEIAKAIDERAKDRAGE